jgi:hypothetical protein
LELSDKLLNFSDRSFRCPAEQGGKLLGRPFDVGTLAHGVAVALGLVATFVLAFFAIVVFGGFRVIPEPSPRFVFWSASLVLLFLLP